MSDIGVSYDVSYRPDPVECKAELSLSGKDIKVTLRDFPAVLISLTPHYSVNIASDIVSTVAQPLVADIALFLGAFAGNFINGKEFTITSIDDIPYTVEGTQLKLAPKDLATSTANGMLKVSGDFDIS